MPGLFKPLPDDPALSDDADEANDPGWEPARLAFGPGPDGVPAPVQSEPEQDMPILASEKTLICLAGPCRYYIDVISLMPTSNRDRVYRELRRYCSRLGTSHEPLELQDAVLYACSQHSPPWWSRRGQKARRASQRLLEKARVAASEGKLLDD